MLLLRRLLSSSSPPSGIDVTHFSSLLQSARTHLAAVHQYQLKANTAGRLASLTKRLDEDVSLWNKPDEASRLSREHSALVTEVSELHQLESQVNDAAALIELSLADRTSTIEDAALVTEQMRVLQECLSAAEEMHVSTLLTGPYDAYRSCFVEIHTGAGGVDAADWTRMVADMYAAYAQRSKRFRCDVIDAREKARTLQMTGTNAYGWWRHEEGVHRLVRISPFDAAGKRHTSFCSVSVFPDPASSSSADHIPQSATLDEKDLKIETFRASGAGGQHVNKTDSAVRITHVPTGLVVACQNDRSQHRNKASALAVLQARLDRMQRDSAVAAKQEHVAQLGDNAFGNQIRSYVLAPYRQVKDVRTGVTIGDPDRLLDGDPALFEKFLFAAMQNQCTGIDA